MMAVLDLLLLILKRACGTIVAEGVEGLASTTVGAGFETLGSDAVDLLGRSSER